ncbi:hypothetical protein BN903_90 [Halorubrum sp. AJ67]|nr:hypothetical protein BN903_90 [Halorubrum sp. AJ67]
MGWGYCASHHSPFATNAPTASAVSGHLCLVHVLVPDTPMLTAEPMGWGVPRSPSTFRPGTTR